MPEDLTSNAALDKGFELGGRGGRVAAFATILQDDIKHIEDDGQISDQQSAADEGDSAKEFANFQWEQQSSRDEGNPFRPGAFLPETITFGEAKSCVGKGYTGRSPEARVSDVVGEIEEHLSRSAVGVDVQQGEEAFSIEPYVFPNEQEGANAHQRDEDALEEFDAGYGSENASLAAVMILCLSGLMHEI